MEPSDSLRKSRQCFFYINYYYYSSSSRSFLDSLKKQFILLSHPTRFDTKEGENKVTSKENTAAAVVCLFFLFLFLFSIKPSAQVCVAVVIPFIDPSIQFLHDYYCHGLSPLSLVLTHPSSLFSFASFFYFSSFFTLSSHSFPSSFSSLSYSFLFFLFLLLVLLVLLLLLYFSINFGTCCRCTRDLRSLLLHSLQPVPPFPLPLSHGQDRKFARTSNWRVAT